MTDTPITRVLDAEPVVDTCDVCHQRADTYTVTRPSDGKKSRRCHTHTGDQFDRAAVWR
ncbi:hypothetical protein SEA_TYPHA_113 [Mycobacterium phage Typha]|uniref:Uncharacterized protein n=1 Tax=Mycobacterium phage Typha TaxID=2517971 RepID=A0A482JAM6_9CAUD|nr:hypothetical protein KCH40_gp056 [Mycobacterium phage Typha]QBP29768.1 hypothetical protein SEA_TYPHA_113 [Mycobacterium phage Typha]